MPWKPKRICSHPGCRELTHDSYCDKHQKEYNKKRAPLIKERYGKEWRQIRNRYIKLYLFCEECLKNDRYTKAQEVHHKIPLSNGGTHDYTNLKSLCKSCHSRITAKEGRRWEWKTEQMFEFHTSNDKQIRKTRTIQPRKLDDGDENKNTYSCLYNK